MTRARIGRQLPEDLSGKRFDRLVAKSLHARSPARWLCICDCGAETIVHATGLKSGRTKSCGCLRRERLAESKRIHGYSGRKKQKPLYRVWGAMLRRCNNQRCKAYSRYGGRGIKVCERWHVFSNFLCDMGDPPVGMSIERINNNGDYEPGNCKWATAKEQAANRRIRKDAELWTAFSPDPSKRFEVTTHVEQKAVSKRLNEITRLDGKVRYIHSCPNCTVIMAAFQIPEESISG